MGRKIAHALFSKQRLLEIWKTGIFAFSTEEFPVYDGRLLIFGEFSLCFFCLLLFQDLSRVVCSCAWCFLHSLPSEKMLCPFHHNHLVVLGPVSQASRKLIVLAWLVIIFLFNLKLLLRLYFCCFSIVVSLIEAFLFLDVTVLTLLCVITTIIQSSTRWRILVRWTRLYAIEWKCTSTVWWINKLYFVQMIAPRKKLWSTPIEVVDEAIRHLNITPVDVVYDIGFVYEIFVMSSN